MKENKKNEQVTNNPSTSKSQNGQNNQDSSKPTGSDFITKKSSSTNEDKSNTSGKELKDKNHEHDFKTPVASSNGKAGNVSEKTKSTIEKGQSTTQGNTKGERSTI